MSSSLPPDSENHEPPGGGDTPAPEPPDSCDPPPIPPSNRTENAPLLRSPLGVGIALTVATFLAGFVGTVIAALLLAVPYNRRIEFLLLSQLAGHGLGGLVGIQSLLLMQRSAHLSFDDLGLRVSGDLWGRIGRGIGIYFFSLPGYLIVAGVMKFLGDQYGFTYEQPAIQGIVKQIFGNPAAIALFFLVAALGAPLWEEMLFRGLLYPSIRSRFGKVAAVALTAFLFALLHEFSRVLQDPRTFLVPIFYLGIILALIRERTGSVVPGMVVHALHNVVALIITLNFRQIAG